jgi:hypothetical protein
MRADFVTTRTVMITVGAGVRNVDPEDVLMRHPNGPTAG